MSRTRARPIYRSGQARCTRLPSHPRLLCPLLLALVYPAIPSSARAQPQSLPHAGAADRTYFGQDIYVAPGQRIRNATCFFCSAQIEGQASGHVAVFFGNLSVVGRVERSTFVIGGNAVVDAAARIGGTTAVIDGNAVYESDESLSGDAWVLGGHVSTLAGTRGRNRHHFAIGPAAASIAVLLLLGLVLPLFFTRRSARVGPR